MKTLILSSSLSPRSRSYLLCRATEERLLREAGCEIDFVDLREVELAPHHRPRPQDMDTLKERITAADNYILGMGVHCYSVNDSLKLVLDNCCEGMVGKFFGILCAGGGQRSYLSTMHLTQICMNEWRMIQLPRVVYALWKDFEGDTIPEGELSLRLDEFCRDFHSIGGKLLR